MITEGMILGNVVPTVRGSKRGNEQKYIRKKRKNIEKFKEMNTIMGTIKSREGKEKKGGKENKAVTRPTVA